MTAFAGETPAADVAASGVKPRLLQSLLRVSDWLRASEYRGYDTFDGLSSRLLRPLTFENSFLRTVLQQGVRRFPINMRPLLGVPKGQSTKAMGFIARGFMRMEEATGDPAWGDKARFALKWLVENKSPGYSGACWGNHFDYQSRSFYLPKGVPTVVWTSLIGHAFLDAHAHFAEDEFLEVAVSACEHILRDLDTYSEGDAACISYVPILNSQVHNANTLGASLLARTYGCTRNEAYRTLAEKAILYTARHQRADSSWYYGEAPNLHWVDNFHTAYVLDCLKHYADGTQDHRFTEVMKRGYDYWKHTFFLADGTPRYYDRKTLPIDIQCASQAIDTLVFFSSIDPGSLPLAVKIADWTIEHMQDPSGYFYYRRYGWGIVNRTPTLHWGQATMLSALAGLYRAL
jgi:hypothetical protein